MVAMNGEYNCPAFQRPRVDLHLKDLRSVMVDQIVANQNTIDQNMVD
jgi:hypothetical protein